MTSNFAMNEECVAPYFPPPPISPLFPPYFPPISPLFPPYFPPIFPLFPPYFPLYHPPTLQCIFVTAGRQPRQLP